MHNTLFLTSVYFLLWVSLFQQHLTFAKVSRDLSSHYVSSSYRHQSFRANDFFKLRRKDAFQIAPEYKFSASQQPARDSHRQHLVTGSRTITDRVSSDHTVLFGPSAVTPVSSSQLASGVHPRILFNATQWDTILSKYAANSNTPNSWSKYHRLLSSNWAPATTFIDKIANLDTSAYKGHLEDLSQWSASQRATLATLADQILSMNEPESHALFLCVMWAAVNDKLPAAEKFPAKDMTTCKNAAVSWAKVLLAHRAYNCASGCPSGSASSLAFVWDITRRYEVRNDWITAGMNLALVYDILYNQMTSTERKVIRSALSMLVLKKASWGSTETSSSSSPNAATHPHRIFSNWATYHSNLFLTNLAIEHDTDFDVYSTSVLQSFNQTKGFNDDLDDRFSKLLVAYMSHSVYPDGSTFEDGYTYFISMREGSLGLIAATRRGYNLIDTPRFRNFILNLEQMSEPWHCGALLGHASGGGLSYATYAAFFRYAYPNGPLPAVVWRRRFGSMFQNGNPCRLSWYQHFTQISILGGEHNEQVSTAISIEHLPTSLQLKLPKMAFAERRGLVMMRNSWNENATYAHFDARPDAFFPGHDNADRGVFTFTSHRQTWITDLPEWSKNVDSRKHSLLHVDGLAQDEKSPSVRILSVTDNGDLVMASADLTYAYNVQWARNWPDHNPPTREVVTYDSSGQESKVNVLFTEKETGDPRSFGWPAGDNGEDLGMTRSTCNMWGDPDMGFKGMFTWKRAYRGAALERVVRSVALVRNFNKNGIFVVADSAAPSDEAVHVYESYLVLHDQVSVDTVLSQCSGTKCTIVLKTNDNKRAEIVAISSNPSMLLTYKKELFTTDGTHSRIIIKTSGTGRMNLWMMLQATVDGVATSTTAELNNGGESLQLSDEGTTISFAMDSFTGAIKVAAGPRSTVSRSPSPTASPAPSVSGTSSTTTPSPSVTHSPSPVLRTGEISPTPTPSAITKVLPMKPTRLLDQRQKKINLAKFSSLRSSFLHDTELTSQAVLQLKIGQRTDVRNQIEQISTCNRYTFKRALSSIAIYQCGRNKVALQNYYKRLCQPVDSLAEMVQCSRGGQNPTNIVNFKRTTMRTIRTFFVAVSANSTTDLALSVLVSHTVTL